MAETELSDVATETDPRIRAFQAIEADATQPSGILPVRKAGLARYSELGYPTTRDEDWRFTNIKSIAEQTFEPAAQPGDHHWTEANLPANELLKHAGSRLVFVDGHLIPALSRLPERKGVTVLPLLEALGDDGTGARQVIDSQCAQDASGIAALNSAYFTNGAFVRVERNVSLEEPIALVYLASGRALSLHPRNLIIVESGASATVFECFAGVADSEHFTNAVSEFVVGEHSNLEHVKLQDEPGSASHIAGIYAHLGRSSRFDFHSLAFGARLSRNNIRTKLDGEGLECVLNGLYLTRDRQLADHHMIVEHARPNCVSHEYFNGILDDQSRGVFHGRILVQQIAQKTDAKQTNKNLLLSDDAAANTKPQLEIYADDVRCTHGATIGQLDEQAIFYLRARGIPEVVARRMLVHAFAGEIIDRIRHEGFREAAHTMVWDRLEETSAGALGPLNGDERR